MTEADDFPMFTTYRGKRVDEMTRDELIEAVRRLGAMLNVSYASEPRIILRDMAREEIARLTRERDEAREAIKAFQIYRVVAKAFHRERAAALREAARLCVSDVDRDTLRDLADAEEL